MSDTKLLQAILDKVTSVDKKVDGVKDEVLENRKRIDKLGLDLAELSDDAPTVDEFDKLEKRVAKVESQISKN